MRVPIFDVGENIANSKPKSYMEELLNDFSFDELQKILLKNISAKEQKEAHIFWTEKGH